MIKSDKYYYLRAVRTGYSSWRASQLIRWNPEYQVDIDEEVDHCQKISPIINKLQQKNIEKPVSKEFEQYIADL